MKLQPDLVIIASNRWLPVIADRDNEPGRQGAGLARLIERIPGHGRDPADTPRSEIRRPRLPGQAPRRDRGCATSRAGGIRLAAPAPREGGSEALRRELVDLSNRVPGRPCPPVIGKTLVYRDHHHLTASFVVTLVDDIEAALPDFGPGS